MTWVATIVAAALLAYVLWTMPIGQRVATRLGLKGFRGEGSAREDRAFLLEACGGDPTRVEEALSTARAGRPDMSDAEAYRGAIRAHLRTKHGGKVA